MTYRMAELSLEEDVFDAAKAKKYETLLDQKWTSIIRLQKKACPAAECSV
jgi:platelet-activating factor acetylhydrolase IB subunit alpha